MEEGVEEQGEVGIGGCEHGGVVVEGGQGDHSACHILPDLFWKLELWSCWRYFQLLSATFNPDGIDGFNHFVFLGQYTVFVLFLSIFIQF